MLEKVSNQSERSTTQDSETNAPSTACAETVKAHLVTAVDGGESVTVCVENDGVVRLTL